MKEDYTPGQGCKCRAYSEAECGCDVDWTPREVYELREQRDMLIEERDLEWFQIIESFANFHPVSMKDALEQGIKRCKAQKEKLNIVKQQRDMLAEVLNELKEEYGTWWAQKRIAIDELKDVTEQRDRLAEELDALKQSILDLSHPNMKLLLEERDETREDLKITQEAWVKARIERVKSFRERDEAREQRDRLVEALLELCETLLKDKPRDITELLNKAGEALTAVKGGEP